MHFSPSRLDPESFVDAETQQIAMVLNDEVEKFREAERRQSRPEPLGVFGHVGYAVDLRPWYEIACDVELVLRAAERLGMTAQQLAIKVSALLTPNWHGFFWMAAWLRELHEHQDKIKRIADEVVLLVEGQKKIWSMKAVDKRHAENRDMRAQAIAWYAERRHRMSKNAAAEEMSHKVVPVGFRTIRAWLINA